MDGGRGAQHGAKRTPQRATAALGWDLGVVGKGTYMWVGASSMGGVGWGASDRHPSLCAWIALIIAGSSSRMAWHDDSHDVFKAVLFAFLRGQGQGRLQPPMRRRWPTLQPSGCTSSARTHASCATSKMTCRSAGCEMVECSRHSLCASPQVPACHTETSVFDVVVSCERISWHESEAQRLVTKKVSPNLQKRRCIKFEMKA